MGRSKSTIWEALKSSRSQDVQPWLKWHPSQLDDCVQARAECLPSALRPDELAELKEFHRHCGADPASMASIEKLAGTSTRVVIAGQQPGILAGPLYSVYKALGAVCLARSLALRHPGLDFVPVFWVASEDHDFDEVRRIFWPGAGGELVEILLEYPGRWPGKMLGTLPCSDIAKHLDQRIRDSTYETEYREEILKRVADAYDPSHDWQEAFCSLFLNLFPDSGLVIASPLMGWIRRRGAEILGIEAMEAPRTSQAVIERGIELEAAGLEAPLHRRPDAINFFWLDAKQRRRPLRLDAGVVLAAPAPGTAPPPREPPTVQGKSHEASVAREPRALADQIHAAPQSFSFNVVTRPLIQDSIFPTVAQMVGPGEAAYFPQVEAVYAAFGVFAPVRYPRPQILLVDNSIARILKRYGITPEQALEEDADSLARGVIERDFSEGPLHEIRQTQQRQLKEVEDLRSRAPGDSAVGGAFAKLSKVMKKGYGMIEERILYRLREDQHQLGQAMARLHQSLSPGSKIQERVLNPIVPFSINYGPDWVMRMAGKISDDPAAGLQIIYMADLEH